MYPLHFSPLHTNFIQTNYVFTVISGLLLEKYLHICWQLAMLLSPFNIFDTLHDLFHCGLCCELRIRNIFLWKLKSLWHINCKFWFFHYSNMISARIFSIEWLSHWASVLEIHNKEQECSLTASRFRTMIQATFKIIHTLNLSVNKITKFI